MKFVDVTYLIFVGPSNRDLVTSEALKRSNYKKKPTYTVRYDAPTLP